MNFIAATVTIAAHGDNPVSAYGLEYVEAMATIPDIRTNNEDNNVLLRLLCYNGGDKLDTFKSLKTGTRVCVTGTLNFGDDPSKPMDLIVSTLETSIPQHMFLNQVVLGNAFFVTDECKQQNSGVLSTAIGTTLDDSDVSIYMKLEAGDHLKPKLKSRIRKGRQICVQGYIREWRPSDADKPMRFIVASNFTTRKDRVRNNSAAASTGTATGYAQQDPLPKDDY